MMRVILIAIAFALLGLLLFAPLAIVVENNAIKYSKNGAVFYTSATQATSALRLHAVLFNMNGAVNGVGIGGTTTTATTTPTTTTPTTTTPTTTTPTTTTDTPNTVFRRAKPRMAGTSPVKRK